MLSPLQRASPPCENSAIYNGEYVTASDYPDAEATPSLFGDVPRRGQMWPDVAVLFGEECFLSRGRARMKGKHVKKAE